MEFDEIAKAIALCHSLKLADGHKAKKELSRLIEKALIGEALEKALEYENGFVLDDGGLVLSDVEALLKWANSEGDR